MTDSTYMDTPRPLSILKQLPPMSPGSTPLKRPAAFDKSPKRARIVTPDFKMPALPARALTPSTSTAAFSSSPQRLEPSSPPVTSKHAKILDIAMDPVPLESGSAIVFGRHRHSHSSDRTTSLHSAIPSHLRHLVADLDAPARILHLPRSSRHASRVHAVAEYMDDSDLIRVTVIGQNGLRLDGHRILPGQRIDLRRRDDSELSFYGASVRLEFPGESRERLFTPEEYEAPTPESSLPPSSPPERRASTPLSEHESSAPVEVPEIKMEKQSTSPRIGDPDLDTTLALPDGIDLPALLASTVVFSGSSKLSLPDLVKHMLEVSTREFPADLSLNRAYEHTVARPNGNSGALRPSKPTQCLARSRGTAR